MKDEIDGLLTDPLTPLQLRLFIFDEEIKNIIFYRSLPIEKALQVIFDAIFYLHDEKKEVRFAMLCLRELVMFLESNKFVGRINFVQLHVSTEATKKLMDTVWRIVCLPQGYRSSEMIFWAKRFINRVYGKVLPEFLINKGDMTVNPENLHFDKIWYRTENDLAAEEQ